MENRGTVFIVDDDQSVIDSLVRMVETIGLTPKTYLSATEFLEAYEPCGPGCLVVDIRMPAMSGLALQRKMNEDGISLPTIVVSGHADIRAAVEAMRNGAINFLEKPWRMQELCDSIQEAIDLDTANWTRRAQEDAAEARFAQLTEPERQVLNFIVAGKTNRAMADELGISIRTVENRRARILKKLQVNSREELLEVAARAEGPSQTS